MSNPTSPVPSTRPNPRHAALLAAEARLKPSQPESSSSAAPSGSGSSSNLASGSSGSSTPPLFASGKQPAKWSPTEKEERDTRIKFARLLDRGLVRDNAYRQVAEGVETLLLIANNIMQHDDPKYRTLKATNGMLKNKVLSLKGGHEYLIAMGFRTQTIDFNQHYIFQSTLKNAFELRIGAEVLSEHLSDLKSRASNAALSAQAHKAAESARVAQALAQIEADRESVKVRRERDGVMRARDERLKREEKERMDKEAEEMERRREEAERMGGGGRVGAGGGMLLGGGVGAGMGDGDGDYGEGYNHLRDNEDTDGDDDDEYEDGEGEGDAVHVAASRRGQGRTLAD